MTRAWAHFGARLIAWLRHGAGDRVGVPGPRPHAPLVLYEFEACPFCRRVREALTRLDLEVLVRPCPKGGGRHRAELVALGGRAQVPFLVDPNTGDRLYESRDIVEHLERHYGGSRGAADDGLGLLRSTPALVLSGLPRGVAGSRARAARAAAEPLVLYGWEAQPESRVVREVLCELELAYVSRPVAPGSARRSEPGADGEATGWAPRLVDPNTEAERVGMESIVDHLEATYALARRD
ncbi:MAG: glutathione S-transferase N-terminal domain-containing protein [Myxococcota bacterium]